MRPHVALPPDSRLPPARFPTRRRGRQLPFRPPALRRCTLAIQTAQPQVSIRERAASDGLCCERYADIGITSIMPTSGLCRIAFTDLLKAVRSDRAYRHNLRGVVPSRGSVWLASVYASALNPTDRECTNHGRASSTRLSGV